MAACPCKTCPRRGCGHEHDTCTDYQAWVQARAIANARRGEQAEVTHAIVAARLRQKGKKR